MNFVVVVVLLTFFFGAVISSYFFSLAGLCHDTNMFFFSFGLYYFNFFSTVL